MMERRIPLGRYLKVMKNPSMTFKELANIMYTGDVDGFKKDWVQFTLDKIHETDIYIVHNPIEDCYCNRYVRHYNTDKDMEEENKVKPLTFLGVL